MSIPFCLSYRVLFLNYILFSMVSCYIVSPNRSSHVLPYYVFAFFARCCSRNPPTIIFLAIFVLLFFLLFLSLYISPNHLLFTRFSILYRSDRTGLTIVYQSLSILCPLVYLVLLVSTHKAYPVLRDQR
jgi:hypothetical protein